MKINMKKWTLERIYYGLLFRLSRNTYWNGFLLKINSIEGRILQKIISHTYHKRMVLFGEGGGDRLYEDPDIDVFYRWKDCKWYKLFWTEQPSFNAMALSMFEQQNVLELCCGYGWYYLNFYAAYENLKYTGCDISNEGIKEGKRRLKILEKKYRKENKLINANFMVADITCEMPLENESVTNVFWYSSMYMFEVEQRREILIQIKKRLGKEGILSGSVVVKTKDTKEWRYAIALVESEEELRRELHEHFHNIYITRMSNDRRLYYMASDGKLPCYNI